MSSEWRLTASSRCEEPAPTGFERGSAIAEFVFVSTLIVIVCAAVMQLGFALHVRNTLVDSAGEGARVAALHGSSLAAGVDRTRALIEAALPASYASNVTASRGSLDGLPVVEIHVVANLPLVGLLGPEVAMGTGRALEE